MRTDPTDNGGLFIGRRPGTAPVRYRVAPQRRLGLRRSFDKLFGASLLGLMLLVALAFWGGIPVAWLWLGAQVKHATDSGGLAIAVAAVGMLLTLMAALMLVKRLDEFWILVRRAAGYDQRSGMIGVVFAVAAVVAVVVFTLWFVLLAGPGPEVVGGRG